MYANGEGVPKDAAKAVEWYRKAAEQGNAHAQFNLARMYDVGEGVPKDTAKAVEWHRKAAEQGHEDARRKLTSMK
jgi:TPR repeat protein